MGEMCKLCMFCIQAQKQLDWLSSIQHQLSPGTAATLQDVRRLIESGLLLGKLHPSCEQAVSELRKLISTCQHYEMKVARLLSNKLVFISVFVVFILLLLFCFSVVANYYLAICYCSVL